MYVDPNDLGHLEELDQVQPTFPTFVLGNEGLGPLQRLGKLLLGDSGILAGANQQLSKTFVARRKGRFGQIING